jgi:hypothetical protein
MKEHEVEEFYKYCLTGKHPAMGSLYVKDKKQTLTMKKKKEGARKLLPGQKNILDFQVLKHGEAF